MGEQVVCDIVGPAASKWEISGFLQCEKTKASLNDLKEKLREAFTEVSELIAALGRECLTQGVETVYSKTYSQT